MLTTQCSFCHKDNVPGTRFCAECGSPLHLKVCPNAACGKVSDATATVCPSCGQTFPTIDLVAPTKSATAGAVPSAQAETKSSSSAIPLIIVAIVAGGLPFLWINRAALPTPKTWQSSSPAQPAVAPPAAPSNPLPPPQAVANPVAPAPEAEPAKPVEPAPEKQTAKAATKPPAKPVPKPKQEPCTEAAIAMGICKGKP